MILSWVVTALALGVAVLAWMHTRRTARRVEQLSQMYWELKYQHGELRARLQQLTGDASAGVNTKPTGGASPGRNQGRSGGVVDAPGKKHRPPTRPEPDASHVQSQAAKVRAAKTMVKTNRRRGRG